MTTHTKTLEAAFFHDGDVVSYEGHDYEVRIYPAEPDPMWGPQVNVKVSALTDGGPGADERAVTDDEAGAIHDQIGDMIFELNSWYWREERERKQREQWAHEDDLQRDWERSRL